MSRGRKTWLMATIFAVSQVCAPQAHSALTATFTKTVSFSGKLLEKTYKKRQFHIFSPFPFSHTTTCTFH